MMHSFFVTGTGTDVGKTYVTALILKDLVEKGYDAIYYKAAMSGCQNNQGEIIPVDAKYACDVAKLKIEPQKLVSYTFEMPVSPHLASEIEGPEILLEKIIEDYNKIASKHDIIVAEGSGGIVCPLNLTDHTLMLTDVIKALGLKVLIVAHSGLGTINNTVLTVEYCKKQGIEILGIVMNFFEPDNKMHINNKKVIENLTGIAVLGCIGENDNIIVLNYESEW